jgi:hypothetical protein
VARATQWVGLVGGKLPARTSYLMEVSRGIGCRACKVLVAAWAGVQTAIFILQASASNRHLDKLVTVWRPDARLHVLHVFCHLHSSSPTSPN